MVEARLNLLRQDLGHRHSPRTVEAYLRLFGGFLKYAGEKGEYTRQDINGWMDRLIEQRMGKNTVRQSYYALKRAFKANSWPWPLGRDDVPPLPEDAEVSTPTLADGDIESLILWAKEYGGWERTMLAMSTVYGLRREELVRVKPGDLNLAKRRFLVRTAKGGIQREHLVPEGLVPHLAVPLPALSRSLLSLAFRRACLLAGVEVPKGTGFHSCRRALDTVLWDATNHDQYLVWNFIRWKGRRGDMPRHYYSKTALEVDTKVFQVHPYLKIWLEGE